jgi:hypothetical protein
MVHGGRRARFVGDTFADAIEQRGGGFVDGGVSRVPCYRREREVPAGTVETGRGLSRDTGARCKRNYVSMD